jgi:hypothetical protein
LLATVSASATRVSSTDPSNERKRKDAARNERRRKDAASKREKYRKKQKEEKERDHQRRNEDYLTSLQRDRVLPPGLFTPIVKVVAEHQKKKEMEKIGTLLNEHTEIRKVVTLSGDREKTEDSGEAGKAAWFIKTSRGRGKNTMVSKRILYSSLEKDV